MRPILYNATETVFDSYGLGEIDANKATVTRERNGNYTLYIEYPVGGSLTPLFKQDMRIKADAGVRTKNQTFYISRIVKDSSHVVKIYAKHISHLTETMGVTHGSVAVGTAQAALKHWSTSVIGGVNFDVWSDIDTEGKTSWMIDKFKNARDALGGTEGSILDIWGGEYEFDNTTIRLHKQLGRKMPTILEYGRNILSAEEDENSESSYTSIYPYASYTPEGEEANRHSEPIFVTLPEKVLDSQWINFYSERRVQVIDFSSKFGEKEIPTIEKLKKVTEKYIHDNRIGAPKKNVKIEYVDLAKTLDYSDMVKMEEIELCDIVPIFYPEIGLTNEDGKIVVINYDVLNDRNESVEIGNIGQGIRSVFTSDFNNRLETLEKRYLKIENNIPNHLLDGKGNKVWYQTPNDSIEHKIGDTWFEKNGIYNRVYVWNGELWEKRIDTEDVDTVKKEIDDKIKNLKVTTDTILEQSSKILEQAGANKSLAEEAKQISEQAKSQFASQFAEYTQSLDGRLANISTQIDGKVNLVDFQRVQETSKLYERIIGSSESDIAEKVSRIALTNQLFQVEVGKYANAGGPNMLRNSRADDGLKHWTEANGRLGFTSHGYYFNGQKRMFELKPGAVVQSPRFIVKRNADYVLNILGFDNNSKYFRVFFLKRKKGSTEKYDVSQLVFNGSPKWTNGPIFDNAKAIKKTFKFNVGDFDDGYLQFEYERNNPNKWGGLFMTELDFYEGTTDRNWQPAPEDATMETDEAVRTVQSQLAGSWAVQNLNSAGDLISGINLGANGHNRFDGKLTHITGETLIDNASIKSAAIESIRADQITTGTLNASLVNIINLNANNVTSGTFRGLTFEGGIIRGNNGNTEIDLNNNTTTYRGQAKIRFESESNHMVFSSGSYHAFLSPTRRANSNQAAWAIGVAGKPSLDPNENFVGLKIFNGPYSDSKKLYLVGDVQIVKDSVSRYAPATSLETLVNQIQYNFVQIKKWLERSNLGSPSIYNINL